MDKRTERLNDEEGVSVAKEWYYGIDALRADAKKPSRGKRVTHITNKHGKLQPLQQGEVFMPFALLESILSIKITDKKPGTEGLLFKASDYEAKIDHLEILINEVKNIHHRVGTGYRLVDFGKAGTKIPLYSKFRFPQKEFTFKQLNSLVRHHIFPESPGDRDGGVGADTRIIFPEVPLDFPTTRGLANNIGTKTKPKTKKRKAVGVPRG